jgi:glycine/serine hydroxymethyltransferase
LPYGIGYGLRLGTTFSAMAGLDVSHVEELADIIAAVIADGPSALLQDRVRALAESARASAIVPAAHWT